VQLELLFTSISNSINEPAAVGLDNGEDLAFECGHGVGMQCIEKLLGESMNRLKFVEMLLDLVTVVNA